MKILVRSLIFGLAISTIFWAAPLVAEEKPTPTSALKLLLPAPQELQAGTGSLTLKSSIRLSVSAQFADDVGRYRWLLDEVLQARKADPVEVVKEPSAAAVRVLRATEADLPKNGYELTVGENAIELKATDSAGVFNGLATLAQLIESSGSDAIEVPRGKIRDWPELAMRAVQIDMTAQQYNAAYVQRLMRTLARYKVNAILMEYSGMFPFQKHPAISRPDAFTEEEICAIRRTADDCNQEIIPLMQCANHLQYVLAYDPVGIRLSEGHEGNCYCLANEDVLPFAQSLIDEIVARHPGLKRLHVGGDEITPGTCKRCAAAGDFRALYLKHYARIVDYCLKRGITPLIWTDLIAPFELRKQPRELAAKIRDAAKTLPREVVGVDWWYRSNEFLVSPLLREAGFQAITASAARSGTGELIDLPRMSLHTENIRAGCLQAVQSKMAGTIITSWSYRGSPHEVCLPEYACAAYGWNTREAGVPALLERFFRQRYAFSDAEAAALTIAALSETKIDLPAAESGRLFWDPPSRTWSLTPDRQAAQLIASIESQGLKRQRASLESSRRLIAGNNALWESALRSAKRHRDELRSWNLSRRRIQHRLELTLALTRLKAGNDEDGQLHNLAASGARLREEWKNHYLRVFTPAHLNIELFNRFDSEPGLIDAMHQWRKSSAPLPSAQPATDSNARQNIPEQTLLPAVQNIKFHGFAANEVYPADIDGDGRLELLCLQSPGCYQSDVFDGTKYAVPAEERRIFCLTAIDLESKVLWRLGEPYLKSRCPTSHVADQMLWCGLISDRAKLQIAAIRRNSLLILDAATGKIERSTDLGADNYVIVRRIATRKGNRLLVQNSDKGYPPYAYASPALLYEAADLRLLATISDAVGIGHSPRAFDIDGDGNEEILIGFDAYDADGKRLWRLEGNHRQPVTKYHVDQLQVGRLADSPTAAVVYAAGGDVEMGTLDGKLLWKKDFGHAQHVVLGDFRSGDKRACTAIYCCRDHLGAAQNTFLERTGIPVPPAGNRNNIAFLDSRGEVVNVLFPPALKYHSGEGILVYPQGCPDGGDALITRDWDWPQAFDMGGGHPFAFARAETDPPKNDGGPAGPGPDGYGVRIADFHKDGRAEVLIHDQTAAWIFEPPYPKKKAANTHKKIEPITGQGWYR
ncbi:MAG: family 20 glycosylhydrolase [Pirellulales bacterium]|nr:family 20 glycosylhydrolase [Pirellulales bacterium]